MKRVILLLLVILPSLGWAGSYALFNLSNENYIVENNPEEIRSIASITKLITAITVLNSGVNLDEPVKVNGRSYGRVPLNALISRMDLLKAMLVSSDNRAAETLANHHPGGIFYFLQDANQYLEQHSLFNTHVVDSSGLLPGNVSKIGRAHV